MLVEMQDDELARRLEGLERKVDATANVLRLGIPIVTGLDRKVNALIDSEIRMYEALQKLSESQQHLAEAQSRTENSLRLLIDTLRSPSGNGKAQS